MAAYRALPDGELAILPNTGHLITPSAVQATVDFFERRLGSSGRPSGATS